MLFCSKPEFLQTPPLPPSFMGLDYSLDHHHHQQQQQQQQFMKQRIGKTSGDNNSTGMVDYLLNNPSQQQQQQMASGFCGSSSFDKLNFADVMQFADFGPKLALNQTKISEEESGIDPVYFLKFPVLNDRLEDQSLMVPHNEERFQGVSVEDETRVREDEEARVSDNTSVQLQFIGEDLQKNSVPEAKNKRKRPRTIKTSEEVESQRMTHIAVERNRRKQMNEHLRVLRSLMPGSYVQRVSN